MVRETYVEFITQNSYRIMSVKVVPLGIDRLSAFLIIASNIVQLSVSVFVFVVQLQTT